MPVDKLDILIDDIDGFIDRQIVGLLLEVHANVTQDTPVDFGWAQAQFVPRINQPYRINLENEEPTGGAAAAAASRAQSDLLSIAASYSAERDGSIFISNNVPYIGALNAGHSLQAPAGYIQNAVLRAVAKSRSLF